MKSLSRLIPIVLACAATQASAQMLLAAASLADMSLEELSNIEITSVSRNAEPLSGAPASIFVITGEDIHRSGATTLPEALRLAPNLQVARVDAAQYAISARGFNNSIGNKLLVLVDGRTVYTPLFSGVFWDQQDLVMEDIERIEVISGPGATIWGANAVNGVINVITRSSKDTQGNLAALGVGTQNNEALVRHGGELANGGHFRIYGKAANVEDTRLANGTSSRDGQQHGQAGFRADWGTGGNAFTFQGDIYDTHSETRASGSQLRTSGGNVLARLTRTLDAGDNVQVQAYFDKAVRADPSLFSQDTQLWDIDARHAFKLGEHRVQWGGGYRYANDSAAPGFSPPFQILFNPQRQDLSWYNIYAQDEIPLRPDVDLTLGLKFERNDYTGTEHLPSARLAWRLAPGRLLWASASRAVRAPARLDREFILRIPPAAINTINGGPGFVSEVANVVEFGYRSQPSSRLTYSVTFFHADYDRLRSGQPGPGAMVENRMQGKTYGLESWGSWQATRDWRLMAGATTLREHFTIEPGSREPNGPKDLGNDPPYQTMLRSSLNVTPTQQFDLTVRRVPSLGSPFVPAYTALDLRYGWQVRRDLELALIGRNLLDHSHPEFGSLPGRAEFEPSAMVRATYRW